jgi:hypothetical protein
LSEVTFVKGISGNPGGLTRKQDHLRRRLEGLTFKAVDVLEEAMEKGTTSEKLAAAKEVFDRAIGKAKSQTTVSVTHNASPHLAALVTLASATASRVIDHQPEAPDLQLIGESTTIIDDMSEETS